MYVRPIQLEPGDRFKVALAPSRGEVIEVLVIRDEESQWQVGGEMPLVMMPVAKAQAVFEEIRGVRPRVNGVA